MPEGYFGQYLTIGVFLLVAVILVLGTLQLARLVRPAVPRDEKITTYESGIDPFGGAWAQVNVRYYLFALLFVVFERLGPQALVEMAIFIAILALALLYAARKKVLEWQ